MTLNAWADVVFIGFALTAAISMFLALCILLEIKTEVKESNELIWLIVRDGVGQDEN